MFISANKTFYRKVIVLLSNIQRLHKVNSFRLDLRVSVCLCFKFIARARMGIPNDILSLKMKTQQIEGRTSHKSSMRCGTCLVYIHVVELLIQYCATNYMTRIIMLK